MHGKRLVTYEEAGSNEGETWIFHAPIWEAGWKDEDIVDAPLVVAAEALCHRNHVVNSFKLDFCPWQYTRLCPYKRPLSNTSV